MKKQFVIGTIIISVCTNVLAGTEIWFSGNQDQIVTIRLETPYSLAKVWIMPDAEPMSKWKPTGINLKNCGNISHVAPGNVVICDLSIQNPVVSFSSDMSTNNYAAFGTYIYQNRG
jgi:hypothetical protein